MDGTASTLLGSDGVFRSARIAWKAGGVVEWEVAEPTAPARPFVVPALPVEIHCHGVADLDFSTMSPDDLPHLEDHLASEGIYCVACMFVKKGELARINALLTAYYARRDALSHIVGFAFEGPLLASSGGTPTPATWVPTLAEWRQIADLGLYGLRYVVLSPDASDTGGASLDDVVELLAGVNVRVALGHFSKHAPDHSATAAQKVIDTASAADPARPAVYTDHLFNDMPVTCRHAWRSPSERTRRDSEVSLLDLDSWNLTNAARHVGPLASTLLSNCAARKLAVFLNFDGEHVDPALAARVVQMVGDEGVVAMTDRLQVSRLAGVSLRSKSASRLWYQGTGVVAAGTSTIDQQRRLLVGAGFSDRSAWRLTSLNATRLLRIPERFASYVSADGTRETFALERRG